MITWSLSNTSGYLTQVEEEHTTRRTLPMDPREEALFTTVPTTQLMDAMNRKIEVGDIITYKSGGYYSYFMSFGLVIRINEQQRFLRLINHNGNKTNLWRTWIAVIIARRGNYDLIDPVLQRKFGLIE